MTDLVKAIETKMKSEGINQAKLSKELQIHPVDINNVLTGKRKPSLRIIKAFYWRWPDLVEILLK
jgi:antitoxin component HigA of HigAB toxin-antitoxin module